MHPLDNVIWQALTTRQAHFAEGGSRARKFIREVSPLAAFEEDGPDGYAELAELLLPSGTLGLFLDHPYEPRPAWSYVVGAPLLQMVCENDVGPVPLAASATMIEELGDADSPEMIELTALTKPGPFGARTHELGMYVGIRREGKLVAMAGERLKVPGYAEVSAVCTHPEHTRKGYAAMLMTGVMRLICNRGEIPFLHVRQDNFRAIELYRRLGFRDRKLGYFAVLRKSPETAGHSQ